MRIMMLRTGCFRSSHGIETKGEAGRSPLVRFINLRRPLMEARATKAPQGFKACTHVVEFLHREADLGGTKLGPRMGVGVLG